jgi:hypothetical protein
MGWIGRIVRRQMGIEGLEREAAQVAARVNILARADEDRRRTQRHGDGGAPLARWRWVAGRWERWSFIEEGFVPDDPPQTLLDHLATTGGPHDGHELRLVDGTWRADVEEPEGSPAEVPPSPGALSSLEADERAQDRPAGGGPEAHPAPAADDGPPSDPTDVAAQIEAWRRRSS